jgi:hypothetical protein
MARFSSGACCGLPTCFAGVCSKLGWFQSILANANNHRKVYSEADRISGSHEVVNEAHVRQRTRRGGEKNEGARRVESAAPGFSCSLARGSFC